MPTFDFNEAEILTFFAVLCRFSVMFSLMPFLGDKVIPAPLKVLLSLAVSIALFPVLLNTGVVHVSDAEIWSRTAYGIVGTVFMEVAFGLAFGYAARMGFEAINFGSNLVGTMIGFSAASMYDPHQESQTEVIGRVQMTLAMLLFLALDGHHLMIRSALESYKIVGLGQAVFGKAFSVSLLAMTGEVFKIGLQLAAPVALILFGMNVVYGVMAKAMPQMNVLVLSFSISSILGISILMITQPEFFAIVRGIFERNSQRLLEFLSALKA